MVYIKDYHMESLFQKITEEFKKMRDRQLCKTTDCGIKIGLCVYPNPS